MNKEKVSSEKVVKIVTGGKGGGGKSTLVYVLADKYPDAVILDMDDATWTSMRQIAYRNPIKVPFRDPETKAIDRDSFFGAFESMVNADADTFICDLGGAIADQLPKFFESNDVCEISHMLESLKLRLELICIVCGANDFQTTMTHLEELVKSVNGHFEIIVAHNKKNLLSPEQEIEFRDFNASYGLRAVHWSLIKNKSPQAMRIAANVLAAGEGIKRLSPFESVYFTKFSSIDL